VDTGESGGERERERGRGQGEMWAGGQRGRRGRVGTAAEARGIGGRSKVSHVVVGGEVGIYNGWVLGCVLWGGEYVEASPETIKSTLRGRSLSAAGPTDRLVLIFGMMCTDASSPLASTTCRLPRHKTDVAGGVLGSAVSGVGCRV